MSYDDLVNEIVKRVGAKLEEAERAEAGASAKPRLLLLAQTDGPLLRKVAASEELSSKWQLLTSLGERYIDDLSSCQAVVLFNMDNPALAKIAEGAWDTPYTDAVVRAILLGKKLFLAKEEVDLYNYIETAPQPYYEMLLKKLELLQKSNVVLCPADQLIATVNGAPTAQATACVSGSCAAKPKLQLTLDKHVITERDLRASRENGAGSLRIPARSVVTDLAREYASSAGIELIRAEESPR